MPDLNGQSASQMPQKINANPRICEISDSPTADHNAPAFVTPSIRRDCFHEAFHGQSCNMEIESLAVVQISSTGVNTVLGGNGLLLCEVTHYAAFEI